MNNQIIILDDTEEFQTDHRERLLHNVPAIAGRFDVPQVNLNDFKNDLGVLLDRARKRDPNQGNETCFDRAAILFVDYRLLDLPGTGFFTGEDVAYLARCFSKCGLIIALNQFGENVFDLTLCGHPESFADLNIGARNLENAGLWQNARSGFRPWSWPLLPEAFDAFERRIAALELEAQIFPSLGFTEPQVSSLPRTVLEFVTSHKKANQAWGVTFREFVEESGGGLRRKDKTSPEMQKRIAAARIGKWLERFVLAGQNTLVDAPHLVSRYPSLLTNEPSEDILNGTAQIVAEKDLPLRHDLIAAHVFPKADWLSRPAWFWEALKDEPGIDEVKDPWSRKDVPLRFCEDSSRFHIPEQTKEFVASVASPFTRRFVREFEKIEYVPELRFSL